MQLLLLKREGWNLNAESSAISDRYNLAIQSVIVELYTVTARIYIFGLSYDLIPIFIVFMCFRSDPKPNRRIFTEGFAQQDWRWGKIQINVRFSLAVADSLQSP